MKETLREMTGPRTASQDAEERIGAINQRLRGWTNYFSYGRLWPSYVKLDRFAQDRVRRWLVRKHKVGTRGECRFPADHIYQTLGLMSLPKLLAARRMP